MKRMLPILAVVCLAAVPQAVLAGVTPGVNLAWDNCYGGVTPPATVNRSFACNTNTGTTNTMYGSYVIATALDSVNGNEMILDLISASSPLPDW